MAADVTPADLAAVKSFCHIDHDEDDTEVASLISAAREYLTQAGIPPAESPLYMLTVKNMVLQWYDNREDGRTLTVGLRAMINQLKMTNVADICIW